MTIPEFKERLAKHDWAGFTLPELKQIHKELVISIEEVEGKVLFGDSTEADSDELVTLVGFLGEVKALLLN